MIPAREEFILDVRQAARLGQRPTLATDSELIKPDVALRALERASTWLTPRVVAKYDPTQFSSDPSPLRDELRCAVERFQEAFSAVCPDKAVANGRMEKGLVAFQQLTAAVGKLVRSEWTQVVEELIVDAEKWAGEFAWKTRREEKHLTETLLGEYALPQLQMYAKQHLYVLDPIARFVPGAVGVFDLSIQPSFYVTSLYRYFDGIWHVHLDVGQGVQEGCGEVWNKESFEKSMEELRSLL